MSGGRRALGRGLGALIPAATPATGAAGGAALLPAPGTATAVPTAPVLPGERGTVAAKVAAGSLRETHGDPAGGPGPEGALRPVAGARFAELPVESIGPNPRQPREVFDEDRLEELATSIREVGLLQPVVVRQTGTDRYELIMGERRWRASQQAGLEFIPAIVRATEDDKLLLDALLENLHRAQLNPLEEAAAYDQLLRDFACTHDELAKRVGFSRSQVSNTLRLLRLPPAVQARVASGVLSAGHARALLRVPDPERQEELARRINEEGLSVRTTEEIVALMGSEGEERKPAPRPKAGKLLSPAFHDLAGRLSDRFETRVKVEVSQRDGKLGKGKVVVEFASVDDLNRILDSLAPGDEGLRLSQS